MNPCLRLSSFALVASLIFLAGCSGPVQTVPAVAPAPQVQASPVQSQPPSSSQPDWSLAPAYGTVPLTEGFPNDPYTIAVQSGGNVDVGIGGCNYGFVANAPDVDLQYTTSGGSDLYIYVSSSQDTTLLINTPSGVWECDDDSNGSQNPVVVIRNAPAGLYDIWVGSYNQGQRSSATLHISEVNS